MGDLLHKHRPVCVPNRPKVEGEDGGCSGCNLAGWAVGLMHLEEIFLEFLDLGREFRHGWVRQSKS